MATREDLTCCGKRGPGSFVVPPDPAASPGPSRSGNGASQQLDEIKSSMQSLQRLAVGMQGNLAQLQQDNLQLQLQNHGLEKQRRRLQESLGEHDANQAWAQFDVVEEHYRQLERHLGNQDAVDANITHQTSSGDLAAGVCLSASVNAKSGVLPTPRKERCTEWQSIATPVQSRLERCTEWQSIATPVQSFDSPNGAIDCHFCDTPRFVEPR